MVANPNRLIVEDTDLQGVVIGIMKHYVRWGNTDSEWPVYVTGKKGKNSVFNAKDIGVETKASDLQRFGVIVDADADVSSTWNQVADFCRKLGGHPPAACPKEGYIGELPNFQFGAWIMPDNQIYGMVEDLCHGLVPDGAEDIWQFAAACAQKAKRDYGASFKEVHGAKAHIHTWLAWQDEPGERMGNAITAGILKHESVQALAFVRWFIRLFDLTSLILSEKLEVMNGTMLTKEEVSDRARELAHQTMAQPPQPQEWPKRPGKAKTAAKKRAPSAKRGKRG